MTAPIAVAKAPVLVSFPCPVCKAPQAVSLLAVARAGHMTCTACGRKLKSAEVSLALHAKR